MTQYRKKPIIIDAYRFHNHSGLAPVWLARAIEDGRVAPNTDNPRDRYALIKTLEGEMRANYGDWIIRGVEGEIYPCKNSIFEATYEKAAP